MNAVSPIYYLHMDVKVTIILAWEKNLSGSILKSRIQAEHFYECMYKVARFLQLEARNVYFFLTFLSKVTSLGYFSPGSLIAGAIIAS